jgi:(S)-2-hydroxyglutarate dehydrogenase
VTLARQLRRRHPDATILLIEKEADWGAHASGRNSGVVHAGFYYTADSLKARFTREGNLQLTAYCQEHDLRFRACGKLVLARDENDLATLDELLRRGRANGVRIEELSAVDVRAIEPRARTHERALYSPTSAAVDPREVLRSMVEDANRAGVTLLTRTTYQGRWPNGVRTSAGKIVAGYVVNAAGLYADRVARDFGFAERYRILPFKGRYLLARSGAAGFRTHLYPVPDLHHPFLGVHVTVTADGQVKLGPTATPAFWREQYRGLDRFRLEELLEILHDQLRFFWRDDFGYRSLAARELRKSIRRLLVQDATRLAEGIRVDDFSEWAPAGIRAQLVDLRTRSLVMDFCDEGDDRSFHVLNAVSPAFTCALPFAAYLADRIDALLG